MIGRKNISYTKVFFIGLAAAAAIFVPFIIWNGGIFLYAGDYNVQQIPFTQIAGEAVKTGNFFWNWNTDLGANFLGTYSFYLLGSPFFWMMAFLPSWLIPYVMGPILMVKIALSSLTAFAFIRRFTRDDRNALIGALLYALSGFSVYNIFFNHFHEMILAFPLLLLSLELFMTENKRGFFAVMVAYCAIANYFFFVGEVVFLIIYFIIRVVSGSYNLNTKKFFSLAFESVAGVGISCILLLPGVMALVGNPRLSDPLSGYNMLLYSNPQKYASILMNSLFPAEIPYMPNFFADADVKWKSISAYLPMFSLVGVFAFCGKNRGSWIKRVVLTSLVFAMVPILNSSFVLFNGSYYARWFYMPILIMCLATAMAVDNFDVGAMIKGVKLTAVCTAAMCLFAILPVISDDGGVLWGAMCEYPIRFWVGACVAFLGLCLVAMFIERKNRGIESIKLPVIGILICAVMSGWVFMIEGKNNRSQDEFFIENSIYAKENITLPKDENFIRYDFQGCEDNQAMFLGVPSIQCFNSVVPSSIMEFYPYVGVKRDVSSKPLPNEYQLRGMLSVKYLVHDTRDKFTEVLGFEKIGSQGGFDIYENKNFVPMGFTYDKMIARSVLDTIGTQNRTAVMMNSVCIEDGDAKELSKYLESADESRLYESIGYESYVDAVVSRKRISSEKFETEGDGFTAEMDMDRDNLVFFSVPFDRGWTSKVNGTPAKIYKANVGFMGVVCPQGKCEIEFSYVSPGFYQGVAISAVSCVALGIYVVLFSRKKKPEGSINEQ